nr:uncharacterized protein LOC128669716 [Plodia interpunctella]
MDTLVHEFRTVTFNRYVKNILQNYNTELSSPPELAAFEAPLLASEDELPPTSPPTGEPSPVKPLPTLPVLPPTSPLTSPPLSPPNKPPTSPLFVLPSDDPLSFPPGAEPTKPPNKPGTTPWLEPLLPSKDLSKSTTTPSFPPLPPPNRP